jgi:hypothetical protein
MEEVGLRRILIREKFEKHFTLITVMIGMIIIAYSALCRHYNFLKEYISLMENIGSANLIPGLFVWLQKVITRIIRAGRPSINEYLKNMKKELRMMGISLYDVHADEHGEYFNEYLRKIFKEKSKRPLFFKFLVMSPDSQFLAQRAAAEGDSSPERLQNEVMKTLSKLTQQQKILSGERGIKFEIRIYDAPATHSLIWVDETMYVGPYLRKRRGYETLWIKVSSKEKEVYEQLKNDFEDLWKAAKDYPEMSQQTSFP